MSVSSYKVNITGLDTNSLKSWPRQKTLDEIGRYQKKEIPIDSIVMGNLRLVLSAIQEFKNLKINLDDLFQVGVLGLIKAIDNFDLSKNVMFSTYAVPMVKGEIRRYLRDNQTLIKVSRPIKDLAYQIMSLQEKYQREHGEDPSFEYLEEKLSVTGYQIKEALDSLSPLASFEDNVGGDDDLVLYDIVPDDKDNVAKYKRHLALQEGLEHLKELERTIIDRRYYQGQTQMEVAQDLEISQAQVSRLEKGALASLKKYF